MIEVITWKYMKFSKSLQLTNYWPVNITQNSNFYSDGELVATCKQGVIVLIIIHNLMGMECAHDHTMIFYSIATCGRNVGYVDRKYLSRSKNST